MQLPFSPVGLLAQIVPLTGAVEGAKSKTQALLDKAIEYLVLHSPAYVMGLLVLVVGFFVAHWVAGITAHALERQTLEPPVRLLMVRLSRLAVLALSAVVALDVAGFQLAALLTGLGVVGVGIGLGMQGLLSNVVAGLTIIFTKPFRVGEYIEILGVQGTVTHIDLLSTALEHTDASVVIIPNHKIMGEILHNYGTTRQLNLTVGVGYTSDLGKAREVVAGVLAANARVLKKPEPAITIDSLGDSAITLSIKPWVKLADMGPAQLELGEAIVTQFRAGGIEIPFPQREIRVINK